MVNVSGLIFTKIVKNHLLESNYVYKLDSSFLYIVYSIKKNPCTNLPYNLGKYTTHGFLWGMHMLCQQLSWINFLTIYAYTLYIFPMTHPSKLQHSFFFPTINHHHTITISNGYVSRINHQTKRR